MICSTTLRRLKYRLMQMINNFISVTQCKNCTENPKFWISCGFELDHGQWSPAKPWKMWIVNFQKNKFQTQPNRGRKNLFLGRWNMPSTTCKLLAVNFNNHVASICKKISKQIAVISRFRKLWSIQTKLTLYKAYILPHFTYCSTVWMHCGKTATKNKLEKLNTEAGFKINF